MSEGIKEEDLPDTPLKKYIPSVLKLRFELVNYDGESIEFSEDEKAVLNKYAKMRDGFIREAVVSSDMSLNALNYMIQRLYGWQNSHLHRFTLTDDTFNAITEQGNIKAWERLCGVVFRFPDEDSTDKYCSDDYDGKQSFKTWLKHKYSGVELPLSVGDTYLDNQLQVEDFEKMRRKHVAMKKAITMDELLYAVDLGGDGKDLLERLDLYEVLCPKHVTAVVDKWLSDVEAEIKNKQAMVAKYKSLGEEYTALVEGMSELRERRSARAEMEDIIRGGFRSKGVSGSKLEREYANNKKEIKCLEADLRKVLSAFEPKILPLTDTLLYQYDFGDGWCVKITCLDGYYIGDPTDGDDEKAIEDPDLFDCREHKKITGDYAELLRKVASEKTPVCVYSDGLALLDDVGGVGGFIEMLKTMHGDDKEEAESVREWARDQGWLGRSVKEEKML